MIYYDIIIALKSSKIDNQLLKMEKGIENFLKTLPLKIIKQKKWGISNLAYPIQKVVKAAFISIIILSEQNTNIEKIKYYLNNRKIIIRNLILKIKIKNTKNKGFLINNKIKHTINIDKSLNSRDDLFNSGKLLSFKINKIGRKFQKKKEKEIKWKRLLGKLPFCDRHF